MRKLVVLTVTLFLLVLAFAGTVWAQEKEITIYVDGKQVVPDVPPYIQNGRTMVPLRFVVEAFGFKVNWGGESAEWPVQIYPVISGVNDQLKGVADDFGFFAMRPGSPELWFWARKLVDGGTVTAGDFFVPLGLGLPIRGDVPAEIRNGRTFVPIRLVAEAFGCRVEWDPEDWAVRIGRYDSDRVLAYHPDLYTHYHQDLSMAGIYSLRKDDNRVKLLACAVVDGVRGGTGAVQGAEIVFYLDGKEVGRAVQEYVFDSQYPEPGSGGAAEIVVRWPRGERHTVKAVVDPDRKHWDRDRSNNVLEKVFTVN